MEHLTDLGNAQRMIRLFGDDLLYCPDMGIWLVWQESHWVPDTRGRIMVYAQNTIYSIYGEVSEALDEDLREKVRRHAHSSESCKRLNAMIDLAAHEQEIVVLTCQLDRQNHFLNCQNGTLNLETSQLQPHCRKDLLTKICNANYRVEAACPLWMNFLTVTFGSDTSLIEYMQRLLGFALCGTTSEHLLPVLYGSGNNGKSTLLNTALYCAGTYGRLVSPDLLLSKGANVSDHPTAIADLMGIRLAVAGEIEDGRRLDESRLKHLTGGDRITARKMRQDFFEFEPTHTIFLATNHKPVVRGTDIGLWRRMRLIPFSHHVPDAQRDPHLIEKLKAEADGILRWMAQGYRSYRERGLDDPPAVKAATSEYRGETDAVGRWMDECCDLDGNARTSASALHNSYTNWAERTGERPLSQTMLGRCLTEKGLEREHDRNGNLYIGIALRPSF